MVKLGHYTKAVSPGKVKTAYNRRPVQKVSMSLPAKVKGSRLGKRRK